MSDDDLTASPVLPRQCARNVIARYPYGGLEEAEILGECDLPTNCCSLDSLHGFEEVVFIVEGRTVGHGSRGNEFAEKLPCFEALLLHRWDLLLVHFPGDQVEEAEFQFNCWFNRLRCRHHLPWLLLLLLIRFLVEKLLLF